MKLGAAEDGLESEKGKDKVTRREPFLAEMKALIP